MMLYRTTQVHGGTVYIRRHLPVFRIPTHLRAREARVVLKRLEMNRGGQALLKSATPLPKSATPLIDSLTGKGVAKAVSMIKNIAE